LAAPPPNPAFVERLEARLRSAATAPRAALPASARWTRRQRWAVGALGLALVLAMALAIVGPRRVLAEFQRLLGYVPGIGFVDLDAARVLTAPVQTSRDGVILRVMQVLAQPDRTLVVFEADGLAAYDPRQVSETLERNYTAELLLPDGSRLPGAGQSLARGGESASGSLRFPPLPPDVTLLLPRLPYVAPGDAPEGWEVPLTLRLATGEVVAEVFPQPYAPV
jgi:hypothetical protein